MPEESVESNRFRVLFLDPVDPSNVVRMESYATLPEAALVGSSARAPYLVLQAVNTGSGLHRWEVLPYGSAKLWQTATAVWQRRWTIGTVLAATGLFALILYGGDR